MNKFQEQAIWFLVGLGLYALIRSIPFLWRSRPSWFLRRKGTKVYRREPHFRNDDLVNVHFAQGKKIITPWCWSDARTGSFLTSSRSDEVNCEDCQAMWNSVRARR